MLRTTILVLIILNAYACNDNSFSAGGGGDGGQGLPRYGGGDQRRHRPVQTPVVSPSPLVRASSAVLDDVPCVQDANSENTASVITIKGENWPDNADDAHVGGSDFNDYYVVIRGKFLIQNEFELFSTEDQTISVEFSIGSAGQTSQRVTLSSVDCDGNPVTSQEVSGTLGTTSIVAGRGDRFSLTTDALTGALHRQYNLLADRATAYLIDIQE